MKCLEKDRSRPLRLGARAGRRPRPLPRRRARAGPRHRARLPAAQEAPQARAARRRRRGGAVGGARRPRVRGAGAPPGVASASELARQLHRAGGAHRVHGPLLGALAPRTTSAPTARRSARRWTSWRARSAPPAPSPRGRARYALGRGHLALGEDDGALEHLDRGVAARLPRAARRLRAGAGDGAPVPAGAARGRAAAERRAARGTPPSEIELRYRDPALALPAREPGRRRALASTTSPRSSPSTRGATTTRSAASTRSAARAGCRGSTRRRSLRGDILRARATAHRQKGESRAGRRRPRGGPPGLHRCRRHRRERSRRPRGAGGARVRGAGRRAVWPRRRRSAVRAGHRGSRARARNPARTTTSRWCSTRAPRPQPRRVPRQPGPGRDRPPHAGHRRRPARRRRSRRRGPRPGWSWRGPGGSGASSARGAARTPASSSARRSRSRTPSRPRSAATSSTSTSASVS